MCRRLSTQPWTSRHRRGPRCCSGAGRPGERALIGQAARYPVAVLPDLRLNARIERTVGHRAGRFEETAPVRWVLADLHLRRAEVARLVAEAEAEAEADGHLRRGLVVTFAPELEAAGDRDDRLLDILEAATSFEVWDRLRRAQPLSVVRARRITSTTLLTLLDPVGVSA